MPTLRDIVYQNVREGDLYEKLDRNRVRCYACGHCCPISDGQPGVCKVRYNQGGTLYVPWGYVGGVQCDPIEKKPFFHAYPGALAYSFGMLGCDLHCAYCQNWVTSQALRDPDAVSQPLQASPEALVQDALRQGAKVLVSTYNEPLITAEWAVEIFKQARAAGLVTGFVSNGNGTPQVLEYIRPWVDLYKVDLKSFDDRHYHELGGRIGPILETIRSLHEMGVWLEIVTLLIPGFNDGEAELKGMTDFLAGVWARYTDRVKHVVETGDIEEAIRAASAVGDDRLQYRSRGYVVPDSFTHGTSEQRVRWFRRGYETGDLNQGDTFNARDL